MKQSYCAVFAVLGCECFKKKVVRTIRELGQLPFFDAQQISPDIKNVNPTDGTLDVDYSVVEKGSSQIELQGGYGGGGFIGTLGLSFNNFASKDLFKKDAYKPFPMGDGQSLALRLQASRFFQTSSFSFTEPWLGGEKPVQFSTSISQTKQFLYNPLTRNADKNKSFNITGVNIGIAKKLSVPDDYFVLSQALSFQYYSLNDYNTGLFTFGNGNSNNLAYTVGLSRNNTFNDPIYPIGGSSFSLSAKFSFPYSLVSDVNYSDLKNERDATASPAMDPQPSEQEKLALMKKRGDARVDGVELDVLPDEFRARTFLGKHARERLKATTGKDYSEAKDSELLDYILNGIFPHMTFWAGYGSKLVYRWRPEPGNPEGSIMDIIMMSPIPLGEKKPEPARKVILGYDDKVSSCKQGPSSLKIVLDQDFGNIPHIQTGMKSLKSGKINFSQYTESRIRYMHQFIDRFIESGRAKEPIPNAKLEF